MTARALILSLLLTAPALAHQDGGAQPPSLAVRILQGGDELEREDVVALIEEIQKVAPSNPDYRYPLEIYIDEDPTVNAGAGFYVPEGSDVRQAVVVVNRGLLQAPGMTRAHLRAVLAHEMAHLALGHGLHETLEGDTKHALTRQQELEADRVGADYLEALGHERSDLVDALIWLGKTDDISQLPWLDSVSGDHASPVMRAALLQPDDQVLEAVALFEHGLMYLECGQYRAALPFFDQALALQPDLHEARFMAARSALQDYYQRLPLAVQQSWLQPDFGPMLTEANLLAGRTTRVTDDDRRRYEAAHARIAAIPMGFYPWLQMYLEATANVLHPDGDVAAIERGVSTLQTLHGVEVMSETWGIEAQEVVRIRYANNLALGLSRLGRSGEARSLLLNEISSREAHVLSALGNLGGLPLAGLGDEQGHLAVDLLVKFLRNTRPGTWAHGRARDTLIALAEELSRELPEIASPELVYCAAVEARVAGTEVGLFDPARQLVDLLGDPTVESRPIEKYPDLGKLRWGEDGDVLALVERGRIVRLSTKRAGDAVLLRSQGDGGQFEVRVGMSQEELTALLDPEQDGGVFGYVALLEGPGYFEAWIYYPDLNFGVLMESGVVAGVTVTPVKA